MVLRRNASLAKNGESSNTLKEFRLPLSRGQNGALFPRQLPGASHVETFGSDDILKNAVRKFSIELIESGHGDSLIPVLDDPFHAESVTTDFVALHLIPAYPSVDASEGEKRKYLLRTLQIIRACQ